MASQDSDRIVAATLRDCLRTRWVGRRLEVFDELDSTNSTAAELARAGTPEGTVVVADAQRRGRGRLGRSWVSVPHRNLYLSLVLRPALGGPPPTQVSLVAGVAVCEAVRQWAPATVKWPNDILVDGRKVAGILAEMEGDGERRFLVLGIGVNLNAAAEDFPPELRPTAGSLRAAAGRNVDRPAFAAVLLGALEFWFDRWRAEGFAPIAAAWHERCGMIGKAIHVQAPDGAVDGVALGLDADGALRVREASGLERRIVAGDVTVRW